jgi:hypothetical protein
MGKWNRDPIGTYYAILGTYWADVFASVSASTI